MRHFDDLQTRFIPAGAGNTLSTEISELKISVYPRWRGEHGIYWQNMGSPDGLSPLARGTRDLIVISILNLRFIPAGAGNTTNPALRPDHITVYPRWRGEHIA